MESRVQQIRFLGAVRHWKPDQPGGLAVADIPPEHVPEIGGLRQQLVRGVLGGVPFASNVMPAGGGRLALSVSKAMLAAAGIGVGDEVEIEITGIGRE